MRKADLFLASMVLAFSLGALMLVHSSLAQRAAALGLRDKANMVARLGLTDLCLFTEARYTRHPVMADLNTPFQDFPMAMEHYPSGSLLPLPRHLTEKGGF